MDGGLAVSWKDNKDYSWNDKRQRNHRKRSWANTPSLVVSRGIFTS